MHTEHETYEVYKWNEYAQKVHTPHNEIYYAHMLLLILEKVNRDLKFACPRRACHNSKVLKEKTLEDELGKIDAWGLEDTDDSGGSPK